MLDVIYTSTHYGKEILINALLKKRKSLLGQLEQHCNFARGSLSSVCQNCNRVNCICKTKTSRKAYRLTYKDKNQKTKIVYVPKGKLQDVRGMLANYKKSKKLLEELFEINIKIFKDSG